jgi:hypothetical protein
MDLNYHGLLIKDIPYDLKFVDSEFLTINDYAGLSMIPYKWFFSWLPNFRFIRHSHRLAKKRICVNFHPLVHKFFLFYFLK